MAAYSGFPEDRYTDVFIILDKMDKIGLDGAAEELIGEGFTEEMRDRYVSLFEGLQSAQDQLAYLEEKLEGFIEPDVIPQLREVMESVDGTKTADFKIVFDPTIVRGMSYYTGTIFEIAMPELGISCGGGGRYDGMVGKFTGKDVPACGFSIGFERIILILPPGPEGARGRHTGADRPHGQEQEVPETADGGERLRAVRGVLSQSDQ